MKRLQQEMEAINVSADKAVEDSEKIFIELIRIIQKRRSDVKQQIRSQQKTEVSRVKELQEKLEQKITELKRKDATLEQLLNTEDHNQFLHLYPSVSALNSSAGGETTVPGLDAVSQKLPVIIFTILSCHCLLHCLHIFNCI
ncbi:hypothetical protein ILYODFUR_025695 [Ilyodon furcidens]|uniref:TRIM8/14/16/25/29/45/65 coiled-coil region domain-containing protein n=1 Tax=Ilyodon furcidens TaxID=33524 RepID=A0ABV0TMR4_9TELE